MSAAPALLSCMVTFVARWTCIHVTGRATWLLRSFESFRLDLARQARQYEQVVRPHDMRCIIQCALHFVAPQPVPQELKAANMRYRAAMRAIGAIGGA